MKPGDFVSIPGVPGCARLQSYNRKYGVWFVVPKLMTRKFGAYHTFTPEQLQPASERDVALFLRAERRERKIDAHHDPHQ